MGQILHGCATTTAALRRAIQHSQESLKQMASHYHINIKTVAKWRKRTTVKDAPMGPRRPHSTVLTMEQEATIVAFRRQTLIPLERAKKTGSSALLVHIVVFDTDFRSLKINWSNFQTRCNTLAFNRSNFARPYICRLSIFKRLTCPST